MIKDIEPLVYILKKLILKDDIYIVILFVSLHQLKFYGKSLKMNILEEDMENTNIVDILDCKIDEKINEKITLGAYPDSLFKWRGKKIDCCFLINFNDELNDDYEREIKQYIRCRNYISCLL
jgi:hypothetical protein